MKLGWLNHLLKKINIFKKLNQKTKPSLYGVVVCVSCVCLLLAVSILFGYSMLNGGLVVASGKQTNESYFLVEANCFEEYQQAVDFSAEIRQKGGAGYIFYDQGFRVFVAGYLTKKDAQSVADGLNYENCKVFELSLDTFKKTDNSTIDNVKKNNIIAFKYAIENLNVVLQEYSKNKIDEEKVKQNITLAKEEIDQQIDNFEENFFKSNEMYKYREYLAEFKSCFDTILKLDCSNFEFSSLARYQEISAMFCLKKILSSNWV